MGSQLTKALEISSNRILLDGCGVRFWELAFVLQLDTLQGRTLLEQWLISNDWTLFHWDHAYEEVPYTDGLTGMGSRRKGFAKFS